MADAATATYSIADRRMLAETADLRVQILTLAAGECVPWHYHSAVADTFVCLEGPMVVITRNPDTERELRPGEDYTVPARKAHEVRGKNGGPCRFLIVQGIGTYDFRPIVT